MAYQNGTQKGSFICHHSSPFVTICHTIRHPKIRGYSSTYKHFTNKAKQV
ncbi:MAG: hypothetical protein ACRC9Q_01710 [Bacteroidales bacterium]